MSGKPAQAGPYDGDGIRDTRSVAARLFAILDAFATPAAASLSLTAIARRADLPLSTTHRLVAEWATWGNSCGRRTASTRLA